MTQLIQIKSNGKVSILFGMDGPTLELEIGNPLIPIDIAANFAITLEEMQTNGISLIHMEQDDYRIFTHTVKAGLVEHQDEISNPLFNNIMNRQDELVNIFKPEVPSIIEIEPTLPSDPIVSGDIVLPADPIPQDTPPE